VSLLYRILVSFATDPVSRCPAFAGQECLTSSGRSASELGADLERAAMLGAELTALYERRTERLER